MTDFVNGTKNQYPLRHIQTLFYKQMFDYYFLRQTLGFEIVCLKKSRIK